MKIPMSMVDVMSLLFAQNISDSAKMLILSIESMTFRPTCSELKKLLQWNGKKLKRVMEECSACGFDIKVRVRTAKLINILDLKQQKQPTYK